MALGVLRDYPSTSLVSYEHNRNRETPSAGFVLGAVFPASRMVPLSARLLYCSAVYSVPSDRIAADVESARGVVNLS